MLETQLSYGIAMIGKMQVVLSAGDGKNGPLASNELFHAGKQAFRYLSPLPRPRSGHTFTALGDDRILLTGGSTPSTTPDDEALIFTLSDNTWRRLPALPQPRSGHAAVLLRDGRVLIAGGWTKGPKPKPYRSTALFAPGRTRDK